MFDEIDEERILPVLRSTTSTSVTSRHGIRNPSPRSAGAAARLHAS